MINTIFKISNDEIEQSLKKHMINEFNILKEASVGNELLRHGDYFITELQINNIQKNIIILTKERHEVSGIISCGKYEYFGIDSIHKYLSNVQVFSMEDIKYINEDTYDMYLTLFYMDNLTPEYFNSRPVFSAYLKMIIELNSLGDNV